MSQSFMASVNSACQPFPLVEKANSGIGPVAVRPGEQLAERSQGPGGYDVGF